MEAMVDKAAFDGLIEMPEEMSGEKKTSGASSDLLIKWLPFIFLVASYVFGFGKRDNNIDVVVQQLGEQRQMLSNMSDRVGTLSDRISKIEGTQDSMRRDLDQDRAYRAKQ